MSSRPSRGAARLAAILDALPDGLLLVNCNGTVVNANTIALEMFETPGTALVGRGLLDLLPEFDSKLIPGSMRRPESADERGRTRPTRMIARRTDGTEYPVEVTSASLENGQAAYNDFQSGYGGSFTGDELLMLVVRDLSGTVDTEAELARSQRQTEMILRAAAEGVVGTDTDGRVVLVNPAAAQILGFRASDLGGQELHPLILHTRGEGEPFPYEESPLADTLRSGRKHRVRGQVLWSKSGAQVPVDLTTAPVRDGDQLVGAVMTFTDRRPYEDLARQHTTELEKLTAAHEAEVKALKEAHAAELADRSERYASEIEELGDRLTEVTGRHTQLTAVLGESLRGPLEELRGELSTLAADPAGQLWPEANQILHHLAAGYARMTTLVDNVLGYQRLDSGSEELVKEKVLLDSIVTAGIDGAVELIGPGRAQFAVHAPPIEAEVDAARLITALAHLVADVAGVDSTGKARLVPGGGYVDSTIVVAAAQRGQVVRIEVRGPFAGGDPVHEPIVRGIVRAHGGVLQTHEMPGMSGSAYVLEVPLGEGSGTVQIPAPAEASLEQGPVEAPVPPQGASGGGRRRARRSSTDAFLDSAVGGAEGTPTGDTPVAEPTGRRRARRETAGPDAPAAPQPPAGEGAQELMPAQQGEGSGRRRGRHSPAEAPGAPGPEQTVPPGGRTHANDPYAGTGGPAGQRGPGQALALTSGGPSEGSVVTAAEGAQGAGARPQRGQTVPPQGVPVEAPVPVPAGGHRARQGGGEGRLALPAVAASSDYSSLDKAPVTPEVPGAPGAPGAPGTPGVLSPVEGAPGAAHQRSAGAAAVPVQQPQQPAGRRARRALSAAQDRAAQAEATGPRTPFALPPAAADQVTPVPTAGPENGAASSRRPDGVRGPEGARTTHDGVTALPEDDHTPPQPHPLPTGRRRARHADAPAPSGAGTPEQLPGTPGAPGAPGANGTPGTPQQQGLAPLTGLGAPAGHPGDDAEWAEGETGWAGAGQEWSGATRTTHATGVTLVPPTAEAAGARVAAEAAGVAEAAEVAEAPGAATAPGAPGAPGSYGPTAERPGGPGGPVPPQDARRQPLPADEPVPGADSTQGRAFSVRTLGQGVPFAQHLAHQQNQTLGGAGRRRKLAAPQEHERAAGSAHPPQPGGPQAAPPQLGTARPHASQPPGAQAPQPPQPPKQQAPSPRGPAPQAAGSAAAPPVAPHAPHAPQAPAPQAAPGPTVQGSGQLLSAPASEGRAYAIGAPDEGAEGPEPLDGPGGAVEVANRPSPQPVDDELPPEPLDNPRRLLVWPAPDVSTQQALSDRGYRPVIVHSREEVDAQIAAFPAALFVDPLTGPITRKALQSLRQAAVAAEVPVLVTAGLGQASREAAYGADPAVLLKALAPRDSEQHPPRVLLIEEHEEIALALTQTLERRGMQVAVAATDSEAVSLATRMQPNLVVMDLMQVRRRRAGIVDWLRANGLLNRTPLVVYTSAEMSDSDLAELASGETVLFLAERSTSDEVQSRIVDLLAKIGTN